MNKPNKKIILFVNGDLPEPGNLQSKINKADFLVAVDGGLKHITNLHLTPNLIIGDLDSADQEQVEHFRSQGVEVRKYPVDKDETDLELALDAALEMHPSTIWIVAAIGNRVDQTLGNIFLLTREDLANTDLRLVDGVREIFIVRSSAVLTGKPGQRVSLLPLMSKVTGIHTQGLKYPLKNETLYPDKTRGISNQMTSPRAEVTIASGLLLCIHDISEPGQRSS